MFKVTTTNQAFANDLAFTKIEGVEKYMLLNKSWTAERVFEIVITGVGGLALNVLGSWIYDAIKKHGANETKIDGRDVPTDRTQIVILITQIVQGEEEQKSGDKEK